MLVVLISGNSSRPKSSKDLSGTIKEQYIKLYKLNKAIGYPASKHWILKSKAEQSSYECWLNTSEGFLTVREIDNNKVN